jgi:hypothetical protein
MRNKEDLFNLIKAMSKSEKRYFVLDAKKSGRSASRYLTLFETLGKMEEFDEEKLKKKFPQNLPSDKAYLYEAILRSMRDYRSASSKAAQVKERLMDARFLYERGLYDQSTGRIAEAKVMAKELEDHFTLLEINKEEQVSIFDRRAKVALEHLESLNEERLKTLKAIDEEMKYHDLYYRLGLEVYREFNLKDKTSIEALQKRLPIELLSEKHKPQFPQAQRRFYLCNAAYYTLLGDLDKVHHYYLRSVNWWDRYPALKEEEFHRYIINVFNLVNTSYKIKKYYHIAEEWIDKLSKEKSNLSHHNQKLIFRTLSLSRLLHLLNQNEFKKAEKVLPEIIEELKKFKLTKSIVLIGNIITVYFLVKDYPNCIYWVDFLSKNLKGSGREDVHRICRLYRIIAYYEINDFDKAEAEVRATTRYYKSVGLAKERFEFQVLNTYLKQIFNAPISEIKESKNNFKSFLKEIKEKPNSDMPLGVDELLIWLNES